MPRVAKARRERLEPLAMRFLKLPFAFVTAEEAETLAARIRADDLATALETLEQDIDVHYDCGNIRKADAEVELHEQLARLWDESQAGLKAC